jgi:uncharacterized transporter YbjL
MPVMTSTTESDGGRNAGRAVPKLPFRVHPRLWIAAAVILALPAVGMQVTHKIEWGLEDFAVFGLMLAILCAGLEAAMNYLTALRWRISAMMLAVLLFLTLWVHLAVGLFD